MKKYILESIVIRTVIYIIPILFFIIYFVVDTGKINWLFLIAGCVVLLSSITETYYVFLKVRGEFYLELGLVVIQFLLIFLFLFLLKVGLVGYFIAILLPRFLIVFIVFFYKH
ncbi:hypothetical protein AYY22_16065 [Photobacterium kishitanii]|nr:hypothetical protein AYY22_16065 [Photobacterium kishitanii]